jgi:hypothetical protein
MRNLRISSFAAVLFLWLTACSANMSNEDYGPSANQAEAEKSSLAYDSVSFSEEGELEQAVDGAFANGLGLKIGYSTTAGNANFKSNQPNIKGMMSSSAALGKVPYDSTHLYLHHANAKFRVEDLRYASFGIEKSVARHEGYVEKTELRSVVESEDRVHVSEDSTLVTTTYTMHNTFVLRVPPQNLDSLLRSFEPFVVFLDYRNIYVEDVTLRMLREELKAKRNQASGVRLSEAVDAGGKLNDRVNAEEAILRKEVAADEAKLAKLELMEKIKLSEVRLDIYQTESYMQRLEARPKRIEAYKPGFWMQAGKSIKNGWMGFLSLIVGLLNAWPLIVLLVIGAIVLRIFMKAGKKKGN